MNGKKDRKAYPCPAPRNRKLATFSVNISGSPYKGVERCLLGGGVLDRQSSEDGNRPRHCDMSRVVEATINSLARISEPSGVA